MTTEVRELAPDELRQVRHTALLICLWWTAMLGVMWAVFVLPLGAHVAVGFAAIWFMILAAAYPVIMNLVGRRLLDRDA